MPGTPSPSKLFIWSKDSNRERERERGTNDNIQKGKKNKNTIRTPFTAPYSLLYPVRGWNVSVALACSGIWDRYPQAAAHSRASGSPAVASQAEDRDARPRCPPPGIRQARSPLPPSPLHLPLLPSPVVTSARAVSKYSKSTRTDIIENPIVFFKKDGSIYLLIWAWFSRLFAVSPR